MRRLILFHPEKQQISIFEPVIPTDNIVKFKKGNTKTQSKWHNSG